MKRFLPVVILLLAACAHPPSIQPVDGARQARIESRCRSIYPHGRWQLVHTIEAHFPGGRQTFLTGVIRLSSAEARIHCVLMTLEGFVLFEAVDDGDVSVKRAFGPFDHPEFAKGVMRDIRLIFMAPGGSIDGCGVFADAGEGCRFRTSGNRIVDVIADHDGSWRIEQNAPPRTVTAQAADASGISPQLTLAAGGAAAYTLTISLIEATALD